MIGDKRLLGFVILSLISAPLCFAGITAEQMMASGKMIRDMCQPKFKVSNEVADAIRSGAIPEDQNVKCYINCILEMMNSIKKGKFNYESSIKQIDLLMPDELKPPFKRGMAACQHSIDGIKNNCEAAATLLKCFRENIKEFTFP